MRTRERAKVVLQEEVAPGIFRMALEAPEIAASARAGQFCMVQAGCPGSGDPLLKRPLSIHDAEEGLVWFLYRVVGRGTSLLSRLSKGDPLELLGPLGQPFPPLDGEKIIFVGGGMGVAPLLLLARERPGLVALIGGRSREELLLVGGVEELCSRLEVATEDGSMGRKGLVTELLDSALESIPGAVIFTCGPMPMMAAVWRKVQGRGVRCWASLETMMGCGIGACMACAVASSQGGYLHVCTDGPVVECARVAW